MLITKQVAYRYVERLFVACGRWLELDEDCFSCFRRGLAYPIHGSIFWDDLEIEVSLTIFDLLRRFKLQWRTNSICVQVRESLINNTLNF
jgi:hypothetical protein